MEAQLTGLKEVQIPFVTIKTLIDEFQEQSWDDLCIQDSKFRLLLTTDHFLYNGDHEEKKQNIIQ